MNVPYVTLNVLVTPRKIPVKEVLLHEVPLLQARFGEQNVRLHERQTDVEREIDDFSDEFARLSGTYGAASNEPNSPTLCESVYGNPLAGGVDRMEKVAQSDPVKLLKAESMPEKKPVRTNDKNTDKVYRDAPKEKGVALNVADLRDALDDLEIDFDSSMKAKELKVFAESAMKAKAAELDVDTDGMGTSDLYNAIVEAI